jgi:hypothetical protein
MSDEDADPFWGEDESTIIPKKPRVVQPPRALPWEEGTLKPCHVSWQFVSEMEKLAQVTLEPLGAINDGILLQQSGKNITQPKRLFVMIASQHMGLVWTYTKNDAVEGPFHYPFKTALVPKREDMHGVEGVLETRTFDETYCDPAGCRVIRDKSYIEASSCGLGKSKAAWESIKKEQTVLCISYRCAFTEKTASDYNLQTHKTIYGDMYLTAHHRIISQVESLTRFKGPPPDVLIVDEFHGIRRQLFCSFRSTSIDEQENVASVFEEIVKTAGRVIVLDADANDNDVSYFKMLRPTDPLLFIANTHKPHTNKTIVHLPSYRAREALEDEIDLWVQNRKAKKLNNKCVIFTEFKGEVGVSHADKRAPVSVCYYADLMEKKYDLRVKWYTGDSKKKEEKEADFKDIQKALANIDVLIFNMTVEAGVSIEMPEFDTMFIMSRNMNDVEVLKQAMHRCRCLTSFYFASMPAPQLRINDGPETELGLQWIFFAVAKGILQLSPKYLKLFTDIGKRPVDEMLPTHMWDSPTTFLWCQTKLMEFRSACHYTGRLFHSLSITGFNVTTATLSTTHAYRKTKETQKRKHNV